MSEKLTKQDLMAMPAEKRASLKVSITTKIAEMSTADNLSEEGKKELENYKAVLALLNKLEATDKASASEESKEASAPKEAAPKAAITEENAPYVPEKGTENMVHAIICRGRRFDPETGAKIAVETKQYFTYGEWRVFQKNSAILGYNVVEVLYNPFEK